METSEVSKPVAVDEAGIYTSRVTQRAVWWFLSLASFGKGWERVSGMCRYTLTESISTSVRNSSLIPILSSPGALYQSTCSKGSDPNTTAGTLDTVSIKGPTVTVEP